MIQLKLLFVPIIQTFSSTIVSWRKGKLYLLIMINIKKSLCNFLRFLKWMSDYTMFALFNNLTFLIEALHTKNRKIDKYSYISYNKTH